MITTYQTISGRLAVDADAMRLWLEDVEIKLTKTEFKILHELINYAGQVIRYDALLEKVWGSEYSGEKAYLHEYIRRLRAKIERGNLPQSCIVNMAGVGYRFDCIQ